MKCNTCGKEVKEEAVYCPNCGEKPGDAKKKVTKEKSKTTIKNTDKEEKIDISDKADYSFLWGLLGYFIPIVGLILFIVWRESKPKESKAAGIGALIRAIILFVAFIIMLVLVFFSAING